MIVLLLLFAAWQVVLYWLNQDDLRKLERLIMATQAELAAQLRQLATDLTDANTELTKVSGETTTLLKKIDELNAIIAGMGTDASQELVDAVNAVTTQAGVVQAGVKAVDDLVPDAPTP